MHQLTSTVALYWEGVFASGIRVPTEKSFSLVINPHLTGERRAMIMVVANGSTRAAVSRCIASTLGVAPDSLPVSLPWFREALHIAGIEMHAPDVIYHVAATGMPAARNDTAIEVRQLTADDAGQFDGLMAQISGPDQDDASVELGHWATFGAFLGSELLAVSSLYPWGGNAIADMGVLTLPRARSMGLATALVRAMVDYAGRCGYEAQYRCQHDNVASNALAQSLALTPYGKWEAARTLETPCV